VADERKLQVQYVATRELLPYARNARTHSGDQVKQIADSIKEFGFTNPILIDEGGEIVAGHGRVLAAKRLKMKTVPAIVLAGLTAEQKRAYVIADNKLALNSDWDMDLLKAEIEGLQGAGVDPGLLGFVDADLSALFGGPETAPANEIGDAPPSKYSEQYGVIVICESEADQKRTYESLSAQGFKTRVVTT